MEESPLVIELVKLAREATFDFYQKKSDTDDFRGKMQRMCNLAFSIEIPGDGIAMRAEDV